MLMQTIRADSQFIEDPQA
uniref:Uncharacterized protein n=1 Tax=Moniliophthora roreri TaxID=221103 RepID=A0A0W0FW36_MONRR